MIADDQYHVGYSLRDFRRMVEELAAAQGRAVQSFTEAELNDLLSAEGRRIIRAHPWRYLRLSAYRTVWIWYADNSGRGLYAVQNALLYLLMLIGLVYAARSREPLYGLLALNVAYFVVVHSAINVQYRFICPVMPLAILFAGLPVHAWMTGRRLRPAAPATA
jgi:hypothetical protein